MGASVDGLLSAAPYILFHFILFEVNLNFLNVYRYEEASAASASNDDANSSALLASARALVFQVAQLLQTSQVKPSETTLFTRSSTHTHRASSTAAQ